MRGQLDGFIWSLLILLLLMLAFHVLLPQRFEVLTHFRLEWMLCFLKDVLKMSLKYFLCPAIACYNKAWSRVVASVSGIRHVDNITDKSKVVECD